MTSIIAINKRISKSTHSLGIGLALARCYKNLPSLIFLIISPLLIFMVFFLPIRYRYNGI